MEGIINISGQIGSTNAIKGVEVLDIISQVKAQPQATSFKVVINSEGGVVDTGFDIHDYLKSLGFPVRTEGVGGGLIASIATVVFMAGDVRNLMGSRFMVHLPKGGVEGSAAEIENYSKSVLAAEKRMTDFYKTATNLTSEAITPLLNNETWLTNDQAVSLGFSTIAPVNVPVVAYFTSNINTNNKMTEADKTWIETLFAPIKALIKKPIISITVTDADGILIDFADLVEGDIPKVNDKATIDGQPAEGEFLQTDGTTYVFTAGSLIEIKDAAADNSEDMQALKDENERLTAELATVTASFQTLETSVTNLKKQITSKFEADSKKDGKKEETEKTTKRQLLK